MEITHFGHSCLLVTSGGARVLVDPGTFSTGFAELTGLDAVVVTHAHLDHYDAERLPRLLQANDTARLVAEPEVAGELTAAGLPVTPLAAGSSSRIGDLQVTAVGGVHAVVHPDLPRIGNVGLLFRADGEPTFFHPGDAYDAVPDGVDVLGVPLAAPWAALKETVDFVRAVAPRVAVPIHDALLSPVGRSVYLRNLASLAPARTELRDLADTGTARWG